MICRLQCLRVRARAYGSSALESRMPMPQILSNAEARSRESRTGLPPETDTGDIFVAQDDTWLSHRLNQD